LFTLFAGTEKAILAV